MLHAIPTDHCFNCTLNRIKLFETDSLMKIGIHRYTKLFPYCLRWILQWVRGWANGYARPWAQPDALLCGWLKQRQVAWCPEESSALNYDLTFYYIDASVLLGNTQLVKFIRIYIRDRSGVFFISSLVRISMTSFRAIAWLVEWWRREREKLIH